MSRAATGTLTFFYTQPVNNSASVLTANVVVNVNVYMGTETTTGIGGDYQALVQMILRQGLWNGASFIPTSQITLVQYSSI